MKIYNTPKEARNLREIEAAAFSQTSKTIKSVHGTIQPDSAPKEAEEESRAEAEAQETAKKDRKKKAATSV